MFEIVKLEVRATSHSRQSSDIARRRILKEREDPTALPFTGMLYIEDSVRIE